MKDFNRFEIMIRRCMFCNEEAIYYSKYRKIRLCRHHFINYLKTEIENTVSRYGMLRNVKKVLIAVSGGKDSVVMLHILKELCDYRNIEILGLVIDVGIGEFSKRQVKYAIRNFEKLKVPYMIERLIDYGIDMQDREKIEKTTRRPVCSVCGLAKRYIMNRVAIREKCDAIATGHNMIDIAQYALHNIITGNLEYLVKLKPVVEGNHNLARKIRPLYSIDEKEIELYAKILNLEYLPEQCPYSTRLDYRSMTMQDMLRIYVRELEDKYPGSIRTFLERLNRNIIPILEQEIAKNIEKYKTCKICGMPSKDDVCTFCRIISILKKHG